MLYRTWARQKCNGTFNRKRLYSNIKKGRNKIEIIVLNFFACPSLQFILLLIWVVGGGNTIPEPNIVHV